MKNINLYLIVALVMAIMAVQISVSLYRKMTKERDRYKNNYNAVVADNDNVQELIAKEFKKYYPKLDSISKKLDIKTRNITNIVNVSYRFKDSTLIKTQLTKDSVTRRNNFIIERPCYSMSGYVFNDSLNITQYAPHDNINLFLHRQPTKHFWFIKWKHVYKATAFSECRNDTIAVKEFINLKKK